MRSSTDGVRTKLLAWFCHKCRAGSRQFRTLPFGTKVTVINHNNGRSAVVRINDRGPFVRGRVIDLSPAAGRALGVDGLALVSLSR